MPSNSNSNTKYFSCIISNFFFIRKNDEVLLNTASGHLLRSKPSDCDEGGVSIGVAALDSPHLMSNNDYCKVLHDNS